MISGVFAYAVDATSTPTQATTVSQDTQKNDVKSVKKHHRHHGKKKAQKTSTEASTPVVK